MAVRDDVDLLIRDDGPWDVQAESIEALPPASGAPTLRRSLLRLVLIVALPLMALGAGTLWGQYREARTTAGQRLVETARTAAGLVDAEFARVEAYGRALAGSDALARGDLDAFDAELRAARDQLTAGSPPGAPAQLRLLDAEGHYILNTIFPPGERRPRIYGQPNAVEAMASGEPRVSNLFTGFWTGRRLVSVAVPVLARQAGPDGTRPATGAIIIAPPRERLVALVSGLGLPAGGAATILDRTGQVVARSVRDEETAGERTPRPGWDDILPGAAGLLPGSRQTLEGVPCVVAYARAPHSGFLVTVAVPETALLAPLHDALLRSVGLGLMVLAGGLGLAMLAARRIVTAFGRAREAVAGRAAQVRTGLREADDFGTALLHAMAERDRAEGTAAALFAASPVGIVTCDTGGRVHAANDAFLRMIGAGRDALEAGCLRWDQITPPEWLPRDEAATAEAVRHGACVPYEKEYLRSDGSRVPVLVSFGLTDQATGMAAAVIVDLTDRHIAETRFRALVEAMPGFVYVTDAAGQTIFTNATYQQFVGVGAEALLGDGWLQVLHPEDAPRVARIWEEAVRQGTPYEAEVRYRRADGVWRWFACRGVPVRGPDGGVERWYGTCVDINGRRELEARLLERNRHLDLLAGSAGRLLLEDGPEAALPRIFADLAAAVGAEVHFHFVAGPGDPEMLDLAASGGVDEATRAAMGRVRIGEKPCGRVARERRPLLLEDIQAGGDSLAEPARALGLRCYAGYPLVSHGRLVGTLAFASRSRDRFAPEELALIRAVADQVAAAVDRARLAAAAQESEAFLRSVLNAGTDCIKVIGRDGRITFLNASGLEAGEGEVLGRDWASLWPEESAGEVRGALAAAFAGGSARFEGLCPTLKGRPIWWDVVVAPILDAAGQVAQVVAVSRDANDRRRAEEALRASEAFARSVLDATSDCITVLDAEGRLAFMNEPGCRQWEIDDLPAIIGRRVDTVWPAESAPVVRTAIEQALGGRPVRCTVLGPTAKGRPTWWDVAVTPLPGPDGRPERLLSVARDVTEQRRTEAELRRMTEELEARVCEEVAAREAAQNAAAQAQKMQALGQLAGGVAHDLNNVLQAFSGGAALIARRAEDPEQVRRLTGMLQEAAARGASVTGRLLAFARRGELQAMPLDAVRLLHGVAEVLSHTLGANVTIGTDCAPGLPCLLADRGQLETALVNLATNARDAMPGGGRLTLSAAFEAVPEGSGHPAGLRPGRYIRLAVADTGQGMDAATLARVVEPFFTTKPKGKGTGLGLSMVKGFAEQSGGGMRIESAPGQGTVVTLWLPEAERAEGEAGEAPAAAWRQEAGGETPRVLVVDDEPAVREVVAGTMEARGFAVLQAADGPDALALLDGGEAVDLLLTDLAMPGMDGMAVIRAARRLRPRLPAILLTGDTGEAAEGAVAEALRGGPFVLVRKPAEPGALADQADLLLHGATRSP